MSIQIYTAWQEDTDTLDDQVNARLRSIPAEDVIDVKFSVSSHEGEAEYVNRKNNYMCGAMILYKEKEKTERQYPEIKLKPEDWNKILDAGISDPDGWRHSMSQSTEVPISLDEFMRRALASTRLARGRTAFDDICDAVAKEGES